MYSQKQLLDFSRKRLAIIPESINALGGNNIYKICFIKNLKEMI